jgi:hypothetical protein
MLSETLICILASESTPKFTEYAYNYSIFSSGFNRESYHNIDLCLLYFYGVYWGCRV